jgi:hypothetical protein
MINWDDAHEVEYRSYRIRYKLGRNFKGPLHNYHVEITALAGATPMLPDLQPVLNSLMWSEPADAFAQVAIELAKKKIDFQLQQIL